jgi:hypothetical protein
MAAESIGRAPPPDLLLRMSSHVDAIYYAVEVDGGQSARCAVELSLRTVRNCGGVFIMSLGNTDMTPNDCRLFLNWNH